MIEECFNYANSTVKQITGLFETRIENSESKEHKKNSYASSNKKNKERKNNKKEG